MNTQPSILPVEEIEENNPDRAGLGFLPLFLPALLAAILAQFLELYYNEYSIFSSFEFIDLTLGFFISISFLSSAFQKIQNRSLLVLDELAYAFSNRWIRLLLFVAAFSPIIHLSPSYWKISWGLLFPLSSTHSIPFDLFCRLLFRVSGLLIFGFLWFNLIGRLGWAFFDLRARPDWTIQLSKAKQAESGLEEETTVEEVAIESEQEKDASRPRNLEQLMEIVGMSEEEKKALELQKTVFEYMAQNPKQAAIVIKSWLSR
ncbi:MAG: hypothetical protein AB1656_11575 [Candidatus Omnitrophota bacterium]